LKAREKEGGFEVLDGPKRSAKQKCEKKVNLFLGKPPNAGMARSRRRSRF